MNLLRALWMVLTSPGSRAVLAERYRQIHVEGMDGEHDQLHGDFELTDAAACYAMYATDAPDEPPETWPWEAAWWKPKGTMRNIERAAALLIAELDRIAPQRT